MTIDVRPATNYTDVATILGPRDLASPVCWCLTYRLPSKEHRSLSGPERAEKVRGLCAADPPPGVLAYSDGEVVGWAGVAPRAELNSFARSRKIPHVDDRPVWTVWCFRTRGGHRGRGIARALLDGAVDFARDRGAPVIEGYPVDNAGAKVDTTMAYVGTRPMFEKAGFAFAAETTSVLNGFPRVLMRRELDGQR